jgi:hypothetical protein
LRRSRTYQWDVTRKWTRVPRLCARAIVANRVQISRPRDVTTHGPSSSTAVGVVHTVERCCCCRCGPRQWLHKGSPPKRPAAGGGRRGDLRVGTVG